MEKSYDKIWTGQVSREDIWYVLLRKKDYFKFNIQNEKYFLHKILYCNLLTCPLFIKIIIERAIVAKKKKNWECKNSTQQYK